MTGPRLHRGASISAALLAGVLFVVMALVAIATPFSEPAGFPTSVSITAEIGYALFRSLPSGRFRGSLGHTEPFLAAFLLVAVLLDAALDAALVLAKRDGGDQS
ncbi:MAG: hypothetical protein U5K37_07615 [Natrialbaceae archaeon]|nr:hypothetical protein [Natrialbaceae archaeon]